VSRRGRPTSGHTVLWPAARLVMVLATMSPWVLVVSSNAQATGGAGRSDTTSLSADSSGRVIGKVVESDSSVPFATVVLTPGLSSVAVEGFADDRGWFAFDQLPPGVYRIAARQIGYAPADTEITVASGSIVTGVRLRLERLVVVLPTVTVTGSNACRTPGAPDSTADPALVGIFAQLRENVDRYRIMVDEYPFRYTWGDSLVHETGGGADSLVSVDTVAYESRARRPYRIGHVVYTEFDGHGRRRQLMYLPTFLDLADSMFLATHCFSYGGVQSIASSGGDRTLAIDFRPADTIHVPDVAGRIYLDSERLLVRRAVFRLTNASMTEPPVMEVTARTSYREVVPLVPIIDSVVTYQPLGLVSERVAGASRFQVVDRGAAIDVAHLVTYQFEQRAPGGVAAPGMPAPAGPP
jgi:hypothetical protein